MLPHSVTPLDKHSFNFDELSQPIPEPATAALLLAGGLAAIVLRRR